MRRTVWDDIIEVIDERQNTLIEDRMSAIAHSRDEPSDGDSPLGMVRCALDGEPQPCTQLRELATKYGLPG